MARALMPFPPVSYTHLDVYKRQTLACLPVLAAFPSPCGRMPQESRRCTGNEQAPADFERPTRRDVYKRQAVTSSSLPRPALYWAFGGDSGGWRWAFCWRCCISASPDSFTRYAAVPPPSQAGRLFRSAPFCPSALPHYTVLEVDHYEEVPCDEKDCTHPVSYTHLDVYKRQ